MKKGSAVAGPGHKKAKFCQFVTLHGSGLARPLVLIHEADHPSEVLASLLGRLPYSGSLRATCVLAQCVELSELSDQLHTYPDTINGHRAPANTYRNSA